jgi:hypothetical protein
MRIKYDDQDDILHIEFSKEPIVKDVSHVQVRRKGLGLFRLAGEV